MEAVSLNCHALLVIWFHDILFTMLNFFLVFEALFAARVHFEHFVYNYTNIKISGLTAFVYNIVSYSVFLPVLYLFLGPLCGC
jgi:succinate dehydrogenase/fumarate reductase cytochrome b subunit